MNLEARCEALQARIDELEMQLEHLRNVMESHSVPAVFGLTPKEAALVQALRTRSPHTLSKEQLLSALYGLQADDEPEIRIIDVFICKARKKLEPFGVRIATVWGRGYQMDEDSVAAYDEVAG